MSKARRWAAKGVKGGGTKEVVRRLTPFEEVGSEGGGGEGRLMILAPMSNCYS